MSIFYLMKITKFIYSKKILYKLFFNILKNKNKTLSNIMTHQEIYKRLDIADQKKFNQLFNYYEYSQFDKNYQISYRDFLRNNLLILKYAIINK